MISARSHDPGRTIPPALLVVVYPHSDALFHRAYRFADTATATGLHVRVV
jgi:hypothetical protein